MFSIYRFRNVTLPYQGSLRNLIPQCRNVGPCLLESALSHTGRQLKPSYRSYATGHYTDAGITPKTRIQPASTQHSHSTAQRCAFSTTPEVQQQERQWRRRVVGAQPFQNLKVGPYKRGKWFVSYKDDPGSFITNILIILVTGYSIFTMMPGESMKVRRQRKLRQVLLDNAQMTEADLVYIENYKLPEDENPAQLQTVK